ncbi:MAG TPA: penicillin-binding protein 2 [Longimicrobiales bacterium]
MSRRQDWGGRVEHPRALRRRRAQGARVALLISAAALTFALAKIQLFTSEHYVLVAKENRLRPVVVRAPRGTIYDRHGQVVAENDVGYQVLLMPAPMDSMLATLARLRPILRLTDDEIERAIRKYRRQSHLPMEVDNDASFVAVSRLQERRFLFPGVLIHEYPKRRYPAGPAVAHLVGYVAEISDAELELPEFANYRQGRWIGKAGIERSYEAVLGGEPGMRYLEVDALGRIKRWLPEEAGVPPIPGRDLRLYLDLDLQRYVAELFRDIAAQAEIEDFQAAFVAIEPQTGGVLALYASPSFDPNAFVGGVRPEVWARLNEDPLDPLLNRVSGAAQPPGSTFKMATASIAMQLGLLKPGDHMPIACGGGLRYQGRYARCWLGSGHGSLDLVGAIKNSCNVYFYQVAIKVGLDRFLELGTRMGLGAPTGIDLPNELASTFPESRAWWERRWGYRPNENEIMSLAIGQSAVNVTPLKLAQIYVAVARPDGKAPVPRIARTTEPPRIGLDLGIGREEVMALRKGLRRVVGPGGTAAMSRLPVWDFMGKTGTAQNPHGDDHAWFVGMAGPWGKDPEIVAAMLLAHGEHGYVASGVVANAVNFYLNRKYGLPFDRYPTVRERLPRGLPVDWRWYMSEVVDPPSPEP